MDKQMPQMQTCGSTTECDDYDVVVVGAGHAGCEAALAAARLGARVLVTSVSLDNVALLACNPSIGGTAKGGLVREIDALGGQMGLAADKTLLQLRMLNRGKGAAVQNLRAQTDKRRYHAEMKRALETQPGIALRACEVTDILTERDVGGGERVCGVVTQYGERIACRAAVLACGVYLRSDVIVGEYRKNAGPSGFAAANALPDALMRLGFTLRRFKTGTPARADRRSIDFSKMQIQPGEEGLYPFSFLNDVPEFEQTPCYLTYTTQRTHDLIRANLHRAPMYSGGIKGTGARYCPSIEDKVVRFADKERHQVFIEPEGADTEEVYIQGVSTSMPVDVQLALYRSVTGLESVRIMRYAYAIEYDCIDARQLDLSLAARHLPGLYCAGQINGSSGYEEAAAQGLIAGINAAHFVKGLPPFVLYRSDAYIGVLIDDLVTKGVDEPYRMMTSRAEYRIRLRHDNADFRLTEKARAIGLADDVRWQTFCRRRADSEALTAKLETYVSPESARALTEEKGMALPPAGVRLSDLLRRPEVRMADIAAHFPGFTGYARRELDYVEIQTKYAGYIAKEELTVARFEKLEQKAIPDGIDYASVRGLSTEGAQKLAKFRPLTVGQAGRITGVTPADLSVLLLYLQK